MNNESNFNRETLNWFNTSNCGSMLCIFAECYSLILNKFHEFFGECKAIVFLENILLVYTVLRWPGLVRVSNLVYLYYVTQKPLAK